MTLPHLGEHGLVVDGELFVVLGAELHNSSSSTLTAISRSFGRVRALGANTVLAPVSWAQFEPTEGAFDTSLVDGMLAAARANDLRLIPLWFGSWKNATSSYAPEWVKRDTDRFPRSRTTSGGVIEHLTPFSSASRAADSAAFGALMRHLHSVDTDGTVVMVQVENEVGLLGDSRDRGPLADEAWASEMPQAALAAVVQAEGTPVHTLWTQSGRRESGTWGEVLGSSPAAEEAFMAWAFAGYVEAVAMAGRTEHSVPLFVNAWLDFPMELDLPDAPDLTLAGGVQPGDYPSGGPIANVHALWRAGAPTIDLVCPDFYQGDFPATAAAFGEASGGRLFIPEMRRSPKGIGHMFLALGEVRALGVSPFGIDSFADDDPRRATLADAFALLHLVADVRRLEPRAHSRGFVLTEDAPERDLEIGTTRVRVSAPDIFRQLPALPSYGLIIEESPGRLLIVGRGFTVSFPANDAASIGILSAREIETDGSGSIAHELNGDETMGGSAVRLHALGAVSPSAFPFPIVVTSTGAIRLETYHY